MQDEIDRRQLAYAMAAAVFDRYGLPPDDLPQVAGAFADALAQYLFECSALRQEPSDN